MTFGLGLIVGALIMHFWLTRDRGLEASLNSFSVFDLARPGYVSEEIIR